MINRSKPLKTCIDKDHFCSELVNITGFEQQFCRPIAHPVPVSSFFCLSPSKLINTHVSFIEFPKRASSFSSPFCRNFPRKTPNFLIQGEALSLWSQGQLIFMNLSIKFSKIRSESSRLDCYFSATCSRTARTRSRIRKMRKIKKKWARLRRTRSALRRLSEVKRGGLRGSRAFYFFIF